jgi:hypothetical protein
VGRYLVIHVASEHVARANSHSLAKHDHTVELALLWVIEATELPHLVTLPHCFKLQHDTSTQ